MIINPLNNRIYDKFLRNAARRRAPLLARVKDRGGIRRADALDPYGGACVLNAEVCIISHRFCRNYANVFYYYICYIVKTYRQTDCK